MPSVRTSRALLTALRSIAKDRNAGAANRLEACRYLLMVERLIAFPKPQQSPNNEKFKALLTSRIDPGNE